MINIAKICYGYIIIIQKREFVLDFPNLKFYKSQVECKRLRSVVDDLRDLMILIKQLRVPMDKY